MIRVGLTGGIGSGKSTVAELLRERGAVIVDADVISRAIVEKGQPALAEIVEAFGRGILRPGGSLDRAALAQIVFEDPEKLAVLNQIMHPRIQRRSQELIAAAPEDAVVVYDMPLLVEQGLTDGWDVVIVVEADKRERIKRVHHARGMESDEIRARMSAQASDAQRREVADVVIENNSGLSGLAHQVGAVWEDIVSGEIGSKP